MANFLDRARLWLARQISPQPLALPGPDPYHDQMELTKALDPARINAIRKNGVAAERVRHLPLAATHEAGGKGPYKRMGASHSMLRVFAANNPWLRAVIDIRKREVAAAQWGIVPDLDRHQKELDLLRQLAQSARRFPDRIDLLNDFGPDYLSAEMVQNLIEVVHPSKKDVKTREVRYRFSLAMQDLTRTAENHAARVRPLFDAPNRNGQTWSHLMRAIVPDILTIDAGVLENRRTELPSVFTNEGVKLPDARNKIVELHHIDGSTIRPCIDIHGQLLGVEDPNQFAYEQWLDGQRVETGLFRRCDLLYIMENPQTDVRWRGYGRSRVESLIITSMLEAMADREDLEEYKRGTIGGFLNIGDEGIWPEDVESFREFLESEIEGTKKIPVTAFNKLEYVTAAPHGAGRDKKGVDKLKRYAIRVCALFEMPPMKLALLENSTFRHAEAGQDQADDGLRNLFKVIDEAVNYGIVRPFGYDDIAYKSEASHLRDEPKRLEAAEKKLNLGIWEVNDAKIEFGLEPTDIGENSLMYLQEFDKARGQAEGASAGGAMQEGEAPEEGEDAENTAADGDEEAEDFDGSDEEGENGGESPTSPFEKKEKEDLNRERSDGPAGADTEQNNGDKDS